MLANLLLRRSYRTDEHNILEEFYIPCLAASKLYRRAVGFFSSSSLSAAAKGVHALLSNGGRMELVASPLLSADDVKAISDGYANRRSIEERALLRALEGDFCQIARERLGLLAWLIEFGRLDIKIAVLRESGQPGIYHEKLGIFSDGRDFVVFTGSPNESISGLISNFECIDVYCSWRHEDYARVREKCDNFTKLWEDRTPFLQVFYFPEAVKQSVLRFRQPTMPTQDPELEAKDLTYVANPSPKKPAGLVLRPYQEQAIINWFRANGRGTLKMATGSGKTITALATVERLHECIGLQAAIIIVPYRHLVTQWSRESERFGLQPIQCFESKQAWCERLQAELFKVRAGTCQFMVVVTTNATFSSSTFQGLLPYFPERTMIIGDEAHNLGAPSLLRALPEQVRFRMALSATPERWFDDEGTDALFRYFGPVLQPEFTLKDALRAGALVPYMYYPIFVPLTNDEAEEYLDLSREISKYLATNRVEGEESPRLTTLLARRSRLIGTARNKLDALRAAMIPRLETSHTLFYCGDGTVEQPISHETQRHVEAVCQLLGNELGYEVDTYLAETPLDEREQLRERFVSGRVRGIVAIRCLDEGVDIPLIRTAFILASSTNPRQFIQRRGRVLRPHPSKDHAEIFDFIVLPPEEGIGNFETERQLLKRELQRYVEFADLALNAGEVRGQLVDLQKRYGLLSL